MKIQSISQNNCQNRNIGFKQNWPVEIRFKCSGLCIEAVKPALEDAARFMREEYGTPTDTAIITRGKGKLNLLYIDPNPSDTEHPMQEVNAWHICQKIEDAKAAGNPRRIRLLLFLLGM